MPEGYCPNCGTELSPADRACPECGSDEATGWSQSAYCENLGIPDPDEEFDHDEFVASEFGHADKKTSRPRLVWVFVTIAIIAILLGFVW